MDELTMERICRATSGGLLFAAFFLLFFWIIRERVVERIFYRTAESLDAAARQRMKENRARLPLLLERRGWLFRMEQKLIYSGLAMKWNWMTPEIWILIRLAAGVGAYFVLLLGSGKWSLGIAAFGVVWGAFSVLEGALMSRNYRLVDEDLLKFLDFLGNYSITAGEVTGILSQISHYMEEPLKSVLDACFYEAQTTGDASLALLSMADKIEHPKFKELVRNLEISLRYSADFKVLVSNSRRAVREHIRARQERRAMMREALVNMVLLLVMSAVILIVVERLIGIRMKEVLLHTLPGRISLGMIGGIFLLLFWQIRRLDQ